MSDSNAEWVADKKVAPIQIKMTLEEREEIRNAAERCGKTMTRFILDAVREAMEKPEVE